MIPVYSISKPFLAQAILELNIPLETQIGSIVPKLAPVYSSRTLASLLNHTSGLGSYGELTDYQPSVNANMPAWSTSKLLSKCETLDHKNVGFAYSNLGYLLLRLLLEQETNTTYFKSIENLVFKPLGITCFAEWETLSDVVPNYDPKWVYSGTFLGHIDQIAQAVSKLAQYRFESFGLHAGLISVNLSDTGFDQPGYNYGFMTDGGLSSEPVHLVGHGGSGPGYELMTLTNTENWKSAFEYSTSDFVQSEAIVRLRTNLKAS